MSGSNPHSNPSKQKNKRMNENTNDITSSSSLSSTNNSNNNGKASGVTSPMDNSPVQTSTKLNKKRYQSDNESNSNSKQKRSEMVDSYDTFIRNNSSGMVDESSSLSAISSAAAAAAAVAMAVASSSEPGDSNYHDGNSNGHMNATSSSKKRGRDDGYIDMLHRPSVSAGNDGSSNAFDSNGNDDNKFGESNEQNEYGSIPSTNIPEEINPFFKYEGDAAKPFKLKKSHGGRAALTPEAREKLINEYEQLRLLQQDQATKYTMVDLARHYGITTRSLFRMVSKSKFPVNAGQSSSSNNNSNNSNNNSYQTSNQLNQSGNEGDQIGSMGGIGSNELDTSSSSANQLEADPAATAVAAVTSSYSPYETKVRRTGRPPKFLKDDIKSRIYQVIQELETARNNSNTGFSQATNTTGCRNIADILKSRFNIDVSASTVHRYMKDMDPNGIYADSSSQQNIMVNREQKNEIHKNQNKRRSN